MKAMVLGQIQIGMAFPVTPDNILNDPKTRSLANTSLYKQNAIKNHPNRAGLKMKVYFPSTERHCSGLYFQEQFSA